MSLLRQLQHLHCGNPGAAELALTPRLPVSAPPSSAHGDAAFRRHDPAWRRLPKVDLHCHIDGALRVATIRDLAREKGLPLPSEDLDVLRTHVQVPTSCSSLVDFLRVFQFFYPFLEGPGAMERAIYELCEDQAADGVVYFEGRFAPVLQATNGAALDEIVRAVVRGAEAGARDFGVECGILLCCYRTESPESSIATVKAAEKFRGTVVGVDLAGDESFPIEDHAAAFALARSLGIRTTIHAGEATGSEAVRAALDIGGARRIGHGVRIADDSELLARTRGDGICVECCLTSNLQTCSVPDLAAHPFASYLRGGIAATLNTDDPGVSGITLSHEYGLAEQAWNLTRAELLESTLHGVEHSFADDAVKSRVRRRIETAWAEFVTAAPSISDATASGNS